MEVYQLSNILHDGIRPLHSLKHWRYHNTEEACHGNPFSCMSEQPFSHPGEEETTMMGLKERAFAPLVAVSLEELVTQVTMAHLCGGLSRCHAHRSVNN